MMDDKEWDNVGKFLRTAYSTADQDMKVLIKNLKDTDRKERATKDLEELKKYAQAGDISATKKDAMSLAEIMDKMGSLVDDYLVSQSDVPDEI
jgi:hypothetical protein